MDIFSIFTLLGGLAFFLYGMNVMSAGLEKLAGGKLEHMLKKMTSNRFKCLILGTCITVAIQSSSAVTVMLVGLVNSGIMQLGQTIGVIMGSNIGTTITAWILSLTGIKSDNFFLRMLKPETFSPILALVGIILIMICKSSKRKSVGRILIGFAVLMYGMELMSGSVSPLAENERFQGVLILLSNPILGVLAGALFTAVIQSSSASVGVLQALSLTGSVTFGAAIPIIMGQNIGTCMTVLLSSIGVNRNAKRVAAIHVSFNIIGSVVWLTLFYLSNWIFNYAFVEQAIDPLGIALVHTVFNLLTTALLLPFTKQLEKLANMLVRDKDKVKEEYSFIDERLLSTPSVAISECNSMTNQMAAIAREALETAFSLFDSYSEKRRSEILANEDKLDSYEDKLGTVLVKISGKELSDADSRQVSKLLHAIGDFERLGDHAVNLLKTAGEMYEKQISFSEEVVREIGVLRRAVSDILALTEQAYTTGSVELAEKVEPLEQVIDALIADIKNRHIIRLRSGYCTIELGFILSDLLTNYERISDHCSNIAVAVIEVTRGSFDTHEYLSGVKSGQSERFLTEYEAYRNAYML